MMNYLPVFPLMLRERNEPSTQPAANQSGLERRSTPLSDIGISSCLLPNSLLAHDHAIVLRSPQFRAIPKSGCRMT